VGDGKGTTRSQSGEVVVRGPNAATRGEYCDFAVRKQEEFRKLMKIRQRSKFPIRINLREMPGNFYEGYPVVPEVIVNPDDGSYSPNVHVALCDGFRFDYLREELVRFYLLDIALRSHPAPGTLMAKRHSLPESRNREIIPDWLWIGVNEAMIFQEEGEPSALFRSIFKSGKLLSVEDILSADPDKMNTLSRAVYSASAGGLVVTLLDQDGGPERLANFTRGLASAPSDQEALMHKFFPGMKKSEESLNKIWNLKAATLAERKSLDILTIPETEAKLIDAITVNVMRVIDQPQTEEEKEKQRLLPRLRLFGARRDEDIQSVPLPVEAERLNYLMSDYRDFHNRDDLDTLLQPCILRLEELSWRSFPLYRPLIQRYILLAKSMQQGEFESETLDSAFAELTKIRIDMMKAGGRMEDILNHHEATHGSTDSGAFHEIDRLARELDEKKPDRRDRWSKYLDRAQSFHDK